MKKVNDHDHSRRRFGPAVVLGPADCERLSPASILSNLEDCSSTRFLSCAWPLKIFFMPRQMVDMKARESVGGPDARMQVHLPPLNFPQKRTQPVRLPAGH